MKNFEGQPINRQSEASQIEKILELTPEEKEKIINNHLIDIHSYSGLMHYTQISNIDSILREGVKAKGTKGWGTFGVQTKNKNTDIGLYLTHKNNNQRFSDWKSLPWNSAGPVAILFKPSVINDIELSEAISEPDGSYSVELDDRDKKDLVERDGAITLHTREKHEISNDEIEALVLSPESHSLERHKGDFLKHKDKLIVISPDQLKSITINRLNRLANNKNGDKNLVPVYDSDGNILWPEFISYDEIKKRLEKK